MTDTSALDADIAPAGDLDAPTRGLWRRLEPAILGTSGIVILGCASMRDINGSCGRGGRGWAGSDRVAAPRSAVMQAQVQFPIG